MLCYAALVVQTDGAGAGEDAKKTPGRVDRLAVLMEVLNTLGDSLATHNVTRKRLALFLVVHKRIARRK